MRVARLFAQQPIEHAPLVLSDVPTPAPPPGHVLVRVRACAVCRTDLHVIEGDLPPRRLPIVPGHQAVGIVERCGPDVATLAPGVRVGVAWVHRTCGSCRYCRRGAENLCDKADFTGYTVDGGYADYIVAPEEFVHPLPADLPDAQAAPLLCAGIIGFRALRLAVLPPDGALGIYGFGAAGHVAIQVARFWGHPVFVCTRDERHRKLALELGASWAGGAQDSPPQALAAAIIFAPAGELVPVALRALDKGGTLVLGGIHMSDIPTLPYQLLYQERVIRSVANNTRADAREFLALAARIPVRTHVEVFPLQEANRALELLKNDAIRGAAVLQMV